MKKIFYFFLLALNLGVLSESHAQNSFGANALVPEVEWYAPETEKGRTADRPRVIISGRTQPFSLIQIDGESVTVLKAKQAAPAPTPTPTPENGTEEVERRLRMNCRAYELPAAKSKVVGAFRKGTKLKVIEYSEQWMVVSLSKGSGFLPQACFFSGKIVSESPSNTIADTSKIESRETRANNEGFFEIALELPEGLVQIPVSVTSPTKSQKTFLISVDVSSDNIKMSDTKVSAKKPPAAAKKFRFWGGIGMTYQTYKQSTSGSPDMQFQTVQAPGLLARGGYWGDQWGLDLYFRDAPGKIEVDPPFKLDSGNYHWRTMEAKGLYQFSRGPKSRIWGLPSQWQLRFGAQMHQVPFIVVDNTNTVAIHQNTITTATLGAGLLLGQEHAWSYEFALGVQYPISASSDGVDSFSISSPMALEAQLGAAYKFAPNWRLGVFSYIQSHSYNYSYGAATTQVTGSQDLFYTTFDLRLGYEF